MKRRDFVLSVAAAFLLPEMPLLAAPVDKPVPCWGVDVGTGDFTVSYWFKTHELAGDPSRSGNWDLVGVMQQDEELVPYLNGIQFGTIAQFDTRFSAGVQLAQRVIRDPESTREAIEVFFTALVGCYGKSHVADLKICSEAFSDQVTAPGGLPGSKFGPLAMTIDM